MDYIKTAPAGSDVVEMQGTLRVGSNIPGKGSSRTFLEAPTDTVAAESEASNVDAEAMCESCEVLPSCVVRCVCAARRRAANAKQRLEIGSGCDWCKVC